MTGCQKNPKVTSTKLKQNLSLAVSTVTISIQLNLKARTRVPLLKKDTLKRDQQHDKEHVNWPMKKW